MSLNLGRDLAVSLAAVGWASLRFDKRGVGASGGDYWTAGFFDNIGDAASAVAYLRNQPDTGAVVPIGHSEGALIASSLATDTDVDGAVLLATTAQTGEATLRWQAQNLDQDVPSWAAGALRFFGTSIPRQQEKRLTKIKASTADTMRLQIVAKLNAKWFREFLGYDPVPALRRSRVPLLAITGSKDVQVNPADLEVVAAEAPPPTATALIPDVDHLLRLEPAATSSPRRYRVQVTKPVDERVIAALVAWLTTIDPGTIASDLTNSE